MTALAFNDPKQLGQILSERQEERRRALLKDEDPLIAMFRSSGHVVKEG